VCFSVLSEHSSGGVGGSGGGGGGNDYSAMFSTPPPHKVSPPGPGDLDNMSCSSSSLLGASGGTGAGHRYPTGPEPTNTATSVYNTTSSKYVLCKDHCGGRMRGSNCTLPKVLKSILFIIYVMGGHYDYSLRAPKKVLATPLILACRKSELQTATLK